MAAGGSYDPRTIEPQIYARWEASGAFHVAPDRARRPFSIVIPPPNVTGALHLGHAVNNTLQDILIRRARMQGCATCWLPGTDHAGIATQAVVERRLRQEQGWRRDPHNPEHRTYLVDKIRQWKDEYEKRILDQLRRMGCSCDWQRTRFTLDPQCARAVYGLFFRLFRDGLIYRGKRLVNWDCELQTAVADDEVYHETVKGHLWYVRYPILEENPPDLACSDASPSAARQERDRPANSPTRGRPATVAAQDASRNSESSQTSVTWSAVQAALRRATAPDALSGRDYLVVATTRPETMLADTAVAVHPDDPRYQHLIGRRVLLPLMHRPIPVIADRELVNPEFGTGCVKVTPGHDPNDYACWQRHLGRPDEFGIIDLLTPDGKINEHGRGRGDVPPTGTPAAGHEADQTASSMRHDYVGLPRQEARKRVVADLEALGLLDKVEPYETDIGHSDRSKTPIEPLRSEQWFVRTGELFQNGRHLKPGLAEMAMEAVRDGRVRFFPERFARSYLDWLGEKRDWCISRQLWWGHRIPVWTRIRSAARAEAERQQWQELDRLVRTCPHRIAARTLPDAAPAPHASEQTVAVCLADPSDPLAEKLNAWGFTQDPDVLDTWFSSALWPLSTFGWPPEQTWQSESAPRQHPADRVAASPDRDLTDLDYFFPTNVLSTARDIISLWVARMVMVSTYLTGRVPFQHVCIHPTIQDEHGRRMSKTAGNGVDPLDLIEMYGADAMRFTLASLAGEMQDVRIPVRPVRLDDGRVVNTSERFELGRNFCNKLWQAATGFVIPNLRQERADDSRQSSTAAHGQKAGGDRTTAPAHTQLAIEDRWILSRLRACILECDRRLGHYQFSDYAGALYSFFWGDFCDWYVELVKPRLYQVATGAPFADPHGQDSAGIPPANLHEDAPAREPTGRESADTARRVLAFVLDRTLRLMHPVIPFITEQLWQLLNETAPCRPLPPAAAAPRSAGRASPPAADPREQPAEPDLILAAWPDAAELADDPQAEAEIAALQQVIRGIREIRTHINATRAANKEPALRTLPRAVVRTDPATAARLTHSLAALKRLSQCEAFEIGPDLSRPPESMSKILTGIEVYVPVAGLVDLAVERKRLEKQRAELIAHIGRLEARLANESFVAKAPPAVVETERIRLAELRDRLARIDENLADLDR